eukprot:TRINITY_DN2391_c0_g1_i1.p1 TRINITY_DN2391_c0_g1~~TRINITY_DN2391_c0_g1_i1.p1  ORF type:complete len:314 (-),score=25.88 TRINITY_DN2391_c0_g1_i1:1028-1969(-)
MDEKVLLLVLPYLNEVQSLASSCQVCHLWRRHAGADALWKKLCLLRWPSIGRSCLMGALIPSGPPDCQPRSPRLPFKLLYQRFHVGSTPISGRLSHLDLELHLKGSTDTGHIFSHVLDVSRLGDNGQLGDLLPDFQNIIITSSTVDRKEWSEVLPPLDKLGFTERNNQVTWSLQEFMYLGLDLERGFIEIPRRFFPSLLSFRVTAVLVRKADAKLVRVVTVPPESEWPILWYFCNKPGLPGTFCMGLGFEMLPNVRVVVEGKGKGTKEEGSNGDLIRVDVVMDEFEVEISPQGLGRAGSGRDEVRACRLLPWV